MLQTSVAVGAERETLARVRSGTGNREPTEGEKPAATGGREKREKPGQLSLASWDHDSSPLSTKHGSLVECSST